LSDKTHEAIQLPPSDHQIDHYYYACIEKSSTTTARRISCSISIVLKSPQQQLQEEYLAASQLGLHGHGGGLKEENALLILFNLTNEWIISNGLANSG
jgi:hypothetical protein